MVVCVAPGVRPGDGPSRRKKDDEMMSGGLMVLESMLETMTRGSRELVFWW